MIQVDPQILSPSGSAQVSHDGSTTITITISNDNGDSVTIQVGPGEKVSWTPPAGWTEARFNADGHDEVFRLIQDGDADAAESGA